MFSFIIVFVFFRFVKCEVCVIGISFVGDLGGKLFIVDGVFVIVVDNLVMLWFYGVGFMYNFCIVFMIIVEKF